MIVILNQIEADLAKTVGQERHNQNQKNGTSSSAQSKVQNDINGFGAELAVAKILNCWPDLSIGPHRRGFDLILILISSRRFALMSNLPK